MKNFIIATGLLMASAAGAHAATIVAEAPACTDPADLKRIYEVHDFIGTGRCTLLPEGVAVNVEARQNALTCVTGPDMKNCMWLATAAIGEK
jgi:hypothetical protein